MCDDDEDSDDDDDDGDADVSSQEATQARLVTGRPGGGSVRSTISNASRASSVESSQSVMTAGSVHTDSNASFISQVYIQAIGLHLRCICIPCLGREDGFDGLIDMRTRYRSSTTCTG